MVYKFLFFVFSVFWYQNCFVYSSGIVQFIGIKFIKQLSPSFLKHLFGNVSIPELLLCLSHHSLIHLFFLLHLCVLHFLLLPIYEIIKMLYPSLQYISIIYRRSNRMVGTRRNENCSQSLCFNCIQGGQFKF